MERFEDKLTTAIVSHYRRHEGAWPDHVVLSPHGRQSLLAACEGGLRYAANRPDGPERYMGVPIKIDRDLGDDEIVVKAEPA